MHYACRDIDVDCTVHAANCDTVHYFLSMETGQLEHTCDRCVAWASLLTQAKEAKENADAMRKLCCPPINTT